MNYIQTNQSTNCSFNLPKATVLLIKRDPFQRLGLCKILSQQNSLTIHDCADSFGSIPFWKKNRRSREIRKMTGKLKKDLR